MQFPNNEITRMILVVWVVFVANGLVASSFSPMPTTTATTTTMDARFAPTECHALARALATQPVSAWRKVCGVVGEVSTTAKGGAQQLVTVRYRDEGGQKFEDSLLCYHPYVVWASYTDLLARYNDLVEEAAGVCQRRTKLWAEWKAFHASVEEDFLIRLREHRSEYPFSDLNQATRDMAKIVVKEQVRKTHQATEDSINAKVREWKKAAARIYDKCQAMAAEFQAFGTEFLVDPARGHSIDSHFVYSTH